MVDQGYTTFGYMKMQMVVAHGGRCAECVVYGDDITDGGGDDLEKITNVQAVVFSYSTVLENCFYRKRILDITVLRVCVCVYLLCYKLLLGEYF